MNFSYNYVALVIFAVILLGIHARRMTQGRTNKIYISMVVLSMVATVCDFLPYWFQYPLSKGELFFANLVNYAYFFSRNLCILLYILFVFSASRTWHQIKKKTHMIAITMPYVVLSVALIWNMFQPKLFYISAVTGYERRSMIFVLYAMSGLYVLLAVIYLFYCRRFIDKQKWLALLSMIVLTLIAVTIQGLDEEVHLEMISMAISLLFMLLFVQRPEEQMDVYTQVFGWKAYRAELQKILITKQKVVIGIITFTNAAEMRAYLGEDRYNEYIKDVLRKIEENSKSLKNDKMIFFEYPGRVYIIVDSQDEYCEESARYVLEFLERAVHRGGESGAVLKPIHTILKFPEQLTSADEVINFGHNHEHFFTADKKFALAEEFLERDDFEIYNNIDSILENAIEHQLFEMYYQPIYNTKEHRFTSVEALIRLKDPTYGWISPGILISTAEQRGLMNIIGNFVLDSVFSFVGSKEFERSGIECVEVNLSVHQCLNPEFPDIVQRLQQRYHVSPSIINFEVTETENVDVEHVINQNMAILSRMGYTFSLDDYGTGYSSIHRIFKLPLRMVKIDKTLVDDMGEEKGFLILKNTIRMIKDIRMDVVVEGIEEKEYAEAVIDLGCDYIQGFYYARPMPKDQLLEFLASYKE